MISVESDCVDCGLPCIYNACPHYKAIRYICDSCNDEVNDLFLFDGQELCINCIEHKLERVEYYD
jgi:hypothetical protein